LTSFYNKQRTRIGIVFISFIGLWIIIVARLFFLQFVLETETTAKFISEVSSKANRGIIYDRNGEELTINVTQYDFWVRTTDKIDKKGIATLFSSTFNKPVKYYINKLKPISKYIVLERNVLDNNCSEIINNWRKRPEGLQKDKVISRQYPFNELAAQTIGYINKNNTGSLGLESYFEDILKGEDGKITMDKNSNNTTHRSLIADQNEAIDGADLYLTLDIEYQSILQSELKNAVEKRNSKSGQAVLINPNTGEILAIATVPSFNPNKYGNFSIDLQKNLVISDAYEPGSTFKIVGVSSAIEENRLNWADTFDCENGEYIYNSHKFHDHEAKDTLTISEILVHSSNIGMVKISDFIGSKLIYKYVKDFGFGSKTEIQLPTENSGLLRKYSDWSALSAPEVSIGQEISATTLQTAMAYCVIANGGFLLKPRIIKSINYPDGTEYSKTEAIRKVISPETCDSLLIALEDVVKNGTATKAQINGYRVAGKTGTAQKFVDGKYSNNQFISSFAGIFPANNPELVCVVSIDSPQYGFHWGNETAAPVAKNVFEQIINMSDKFEPEYNLEKHYFAEKQELLK
jgi:cell division protein FtsI (penicillin-binding protein 3)